MMMRSFIPLLMLLFAWRLLAWTGHLPKWMTRTITVWRSGEGWFPKTRSALPKENAPTALKDHHHGK